MPANLVSCTCCRIACDSNWADNIACMATPNSAIGAAAASNSVQKMRRPARLARKVPWIFIARLLSGVSLPGGRAWLAQ